MRRLPVIVLVLMALAIGAPGLLGLLSPRAIFPTLGSLGVDALNEARAVGGTRLGIAIVLLIGAFSAERRRAALMFGLVLFAAALAGRLLSAGADGMPAVMLKPLILEAVLVVLAVAATRVRPTS